ncbi:DUF2470 domain-containing protein [Streptomyces sp. NPDC005970]|uniref:DUF2470 domain-containing protein n=1 Tax=Streptomyces sp. NPDC005970 TaxID=3156723 RepID=UPI0033DE6073
MFRPGIPLPSTGQSTEEGQPRPKEEAPRPSAAERVRTLVESKATASLSIPGIEAAATPGEHLADAPAARAVTPDGDVLLLLPGGSAAARAAAYAQDDELTCVMEITDVAPVAIPHRIRGRAWVAGWLTPVRDRQRAASAALLASRHPVGELLGIGEAPAGGGGGWALLRLEVGEACVDDLWGAEAVEPEALTTAAPDPLAPHEAELLQHLHAAHDDQLRRLCTLLDDHPDRACGARGRAIPVALDRFGLRVRFPDAPGSPFDARFDFPEPVRNVSELRRAMHALFDAAADQAD